MLVELHTHTLASDGGLSGLQTVEYLVKERKISAIAVTDHDSTDALTEAASAAEELGVHFIPGFECSTRCSQLDISLLHILGYFAEVNVPAEGKWFQGIFDRLRIGTIQRLEAMCKNSQEHPLVIDGREISLFLEETCRGKRNSGRTTTFLKVFVKKVKEATAYDLPVFDLRNLLVGDQEVYQKHQAFLNSHANLLPAVQGWYCPRVQGLIPEAEEVISHIRRLGGISVLPHPYEGVRIKGKEKSPIRKEWFREFIVYGLAGVEVYAPKGTAEEMRNFTQWAENYGLVITGGTDFHGPHPGSDRVPGYYKEGQPIPESCFWDLWRAVHR